MKFEKVEKLEKIRNERQSSKERIKLLDDMSKSGFEAMQITDIPDEVNVKNLSSSFRVSALHYGYTQLKFSYRNGKIFCINTGLEKS